MKISITELNAEDRPREKLEAQGPAALSKAELLAILIGSGNTEENAVQLMQRVMNDCDGSLATLGNLSIRELCQYKGMGPAKAVTILAACELGKRRQKEKVQERESLNSATAIYNYMHPQMQDLDVEEAWVLLMNQSYKLIKAVRISHGGITETAVDVRIIMREAILANATTLAICHNHPSNNTRPSAGDDRITDIVNKACQTMRIHFVDHLIITDGRYYSYREEGKI